MRNRCVGTWMLLEWKLLHGRLLILVKSVMLPSSGMYLLCGRWRCVPSLPLPSFSSPFRWLVSVNITVVRVVMLCAIHVAPIERHSLQWDSNYLSGYANHVRLRWQMILPSSSQLLSHYIDGSCPFTSLLIVIVLFQSDPSRSLSRSSNWRHFTTSSANARKTGHCWSEQNCIHLGY